MYTIGETATKLNMSISTLRYYDKEGLLPFLKRTTSGIRIFTDEDLDHLQLIEYLKATGMPLKKIKQFFDWYMKGDSTLKQRRDLFYERKQTVELQIKELQQALNTINYKCWLYDNAVEAGTINAYKQIELKDIPEDIRIFIKNK